MELYIGGYAQGKREYLLHKYEKAIWLEGTDSSALDTLPIAVGEEKQRVILNGFHHWMRLKLQDDAKREEIVQTLMEVEKKGYILCIISDEIGNGIVPLEKEERNWREETGRVLCDIAEVSDRVERIICGIPQILK